MEHLKTGDLVMFQGRIWSSYIVRLLTNSKWTHCGILWRDPPGHPAGLYLLQSDGTLDDFGVQLSPFSKYVEEYPGKVFVYPVQEVDPTRFEPFAAIYQRTQDAGYALYPPDIVRVLTGGCMRRTRQTQYFVCSTYASYVYEQVGLVCPCNDWTLVQPRHLVEPTPKVQWQNCSFGTPVRLK